MQSYESKQNCEHKMKIFRFGLKNCQKIFISRPMITLKYMPFNFSIINYQNRKRNFSTWNCNCGYAATTIFGCAVWLTSSIRNDSKTWNIYACLKAWHTFERVYFYSYSPFSGLYALMMIIFNCVVLLQWIV